MTLRMFFIFFALSPLLHAQCTFTHNVSVSSSIQCNGDSNGAITANVSGTGPFTFLWSTGQTDATATGLWAGCYTVTITDGLSCATDTTVCIFQPGPLSVFSNGNPSACSLCNGDAAALAGGGTAPYTYLWSNAGTGQNITGLCPGIYTVTVTDNNACTATGTASTVQTNIPTCNPFVNTPASCSSCCDGTLESNPSGGTGPFSFLWLPGSQVTAQATGLCPGNYTVVVTDANGCTCSDTIYLPFTVGFTEAGEEILQLILNDNSLSIFTSIPAKVNIYELSGRSLIAFSISEGNNVIDISGLQAGIYYLREKNGIIIRRFYKN